MTKLAKRLTAALTTAAVLAASLVTTASAYTASSGSNEGTTYERTYTRTVSSMTHYGKFESGSFYNSYSKYIDGYTTLERYQLSGTSITMREIKTHGILHNAPGDSYSTIYTEDPLTDKSAVAFESGSTYRVGVAANNNVGGLAISEVSATASSPSKYVEKSATKQTGSPLTAYGNVRYQKGSNVIAGYYEVENY